MTRSDQSLQSVLLEQQSAGFIARKAEVSLFTSNLETAVEDLDRRVLFAVHGDSGVGKTTLVKRWKRIAQERGAVTAYVNESALGAPEAMMQVAQELALRGLTMSKFLSAYKDYSSRRHEVESDPAAPEGVAAFLTTTAVRVGWHAAQSVPGLGGALKAADDAFGTEDEFAAQVNSLRVYLARKFRSKDDVRMLLSPAESLTPTFISELATLCESRGLALFFDAYERTGGFLDDWLTAVLDGRFGLLPANTVITVSGLRAPRTGPWARFLGAFADVRLRPFTEEEAREFLSHRHVTDEDVVRLILDMTGRLPLYLDMLAVSRPRSASELGDVSGDVIEKYLSREDPERRAAALTAALPREVNQDILEVLTRPEDGTLTTEQLFDWLLNQPFVNPSAGRGRYHEIARASMLLRARTRSPERWRRNHRALARHFGSSRPATDQIDLWDGGARLADKLEECYHLLCADPGESLPGVLSDAARACGRGPSTAERWAQMIFDAGTDAGEESVRVWGEQLLHALRVPSDTVISYTATLIDRAKLEPAARADALHARAVARLRLAQHEQALRDFDEAVSLDPGSALHRTGRASALRAVERFDEALADLDRALELHPEFIWALVQRGATRHRMDHPPADVLDDLTRALRLDPQHVWALATRADVYRSLGRYDEAAADADHAVALNEGHVWARVVRGAILEARGLSEEAIADYSLAVAINPAHVQARVLRGRAYVADGRLPEALADFDDALDLNPDHLQALLDRSAAHRRLGRGAEAAADLNRALENLQRARVIPRRISDRRGEGRSLEQLGASLHALGLYDDAYTCYSEALAAYTEIGDTSAGERVRGLMPALFDPAGQPDTTSARTAVIPASIYLSEESAHEAVEAAVERLLAEAGLRIEERDDPQFGSWFRRLTASTHDRGASAAGLERAGDLAALAFRQQQVDLVQSTAVAQLVSSLATVENCVIHVGSLLVVKAHGATAVVTLSQAQLRSLEERPSLLRTPDLILSALGLPQESAAADTRPAEPEGVRAAGAAARLGFEPGQTVLEVGYEVEDCDEELRAGIEAVTGNNLVDDVYEEAADAVVLWWRGYDGDLVEELVDALADLADGGRIWLLTPKPGRDGHVEPGEIEEAAVDAGLAHAGSLSAAPNWVGTRLEAADGGAGVGQAESEPFFARDVPTRSTVDRRS